MRPPWWTHFPGPVGAQPLPLRQTAITPFHYLPETAQPPPYRPGWATPPAHAVRELNPFNPVAPAQPRHQAAATDGANAWGAERHPANSEPSAEPPAAAAAAKPLSPTEQQMQNILDCQNWAQAERKKDPRYREKKNFAMLYNMATLPTSL